jgi:hypothetical protein
MGHVTNKALARVMRDLPALTVDLVQTHFCSFLFATYAAILRVKMASVIIMVPKYVYATRGLQGLPVIDVMVIIITLAIQSVPHAHVLKMATVMLMVHVFVKMKNIPAHIAIRVYKECMGFLCASTML